MFELREIRSVPTLMHWHIEILNEVFGVKPRPRLLVAVRRYYREHITDGSHLAFVAEENGVDCGYGSVCFTEEVPSPGNQTGRCACITNIYVKQLYQNRGIEVLILRRLLQEAYDRKCGKISFEITY
ncbi:MAG: GNAT family N-acetyltransferase [Duncaniella sp.]|nr:GNAT family N-acetyltransferase [Duncaniella sp.]